MGTDYTAVFGIGYEITPPIDENDESTHRRYLDYIVEDMYDFEKFVTKTSKYKICGTGDILNGNEEDFRCYIFLKEPFDHGEDLTPLKKELVKYCKIMKIEVRSDFGLHGDLRIS